MSNKLSVRRAVIRHPKICVAGPTATTGISALWGPGCRPPPGAWPPAIFPLEWRYTCEPMMGPCEGGADIDMERQLEVWDWQGSGPPPEGIWGQWLVDTETKTAQLTITGTNDQWGTYWLEKYNIPVIWDTPTLYVISSWDMIDWWFTSAVATFTF